jgi:hypothetical protein
VLEASKQPESPCPSGVADAAEGGDGASIDRQGAWGGPRRLFDLFDSPVYGFHDPLVLWWSDDQLRPIVERLRPRLPESLTARMLLAIAACALSLVVAKMVSGKPLRYARAKEPYRVPKRYRSGGHFDTWHYVMTAMDVLAEAGLIQQALGVWGPARPGPPVGGLGDR